MRETYCGCQNTYLESALNTGELVQLVSGHPYEGRIGVIIDKTLEILPPGTNRILVYKVLSDGIIINVPLRWMVRI